MIHKSPLPDVVIPEVPLTTFVFADALTRADKVAFVEGASGRTVTYGELLDAVQRFAGGLTAKGFGPGQVLAIMAPNLPEYAVWFHGVAMTGGVITTVNPTYTARRGAPPAERRGRHPHGDHPDVPRDRAGSGEGHQGRDDLRRRRRWRRSRADRAR